MGNISLRNLLFTSWEYPGRQLPPIVLTRILSDLRPYLTERGDHGVIKYSWYHRNFKEEAESKFSHGSEDNMYHTNFYC